MYQTLYRKYRPRNFDEVVGQEVVVKTLKHAIIHQKLNHAYLFTGPRGTGKTSIAKIFAKTINCMDLKETNPCNECVSCTQINRKQSVDIIEIDAASNNGVDEIRELRNKANLVPSAGKYKVYIIDEVHMLTTGAFNALLKTLEEPPAHIIFILATTEPHKIPATILSRCQRFDFKKIPQNQMIEHLKEVAKEEEIKASEKVYDEIARLSDGCMRDALSIFDQVIAYSDEEVKVDDVHEINGTLPLEQLQLFVTSILDCNYEHTFNLIDEYDKKGKNFIKLTEEILLFLRNVLLTVNIPNYYREDEISFKVYETIKEKINEEKLLAFLKTLNETIPDMKKASNVKIVFEMAIIQIMNFEKKQTFQNQQEQAKIELSETITDIPKKKVEEEPVKKEIHEEQIDPYELKEEKETSKKLERKTVEKEYDQEWLKKIENIQNIRVNNTLCDFDKKLLLQLKKATFEVRNLTIDPEYNEVASIIIDGELKAASKDHVIFVYPTKRMKLDFNAKLLLVDEVLSKVYNSLYEGIAVDHEEWDTIKKQFNNKLKEYQYIIEPENLEQYLGTVQNNETPIDNLFGELVEYN